MDLSDLGFAEITPESENSDSKGYITEYKLLLGKHRNGEITREEWFDRLMILKGRFGIAPDPRQLYLPWVKEHLKNKEKKALE